MAMYTKKRKDELDEFISKIGLKIDNYEYLDRAMTHSSYTFENKLPGSLNYERLEFLGDAVLKLIASSYLYKRFSDYPEGELTKIRSILISDNTLAKLAKKIEIGKYLKLGYHEKKMGGSSRPSNLACAFEAILGAFYLDGKFSALYDFLIPLFEPEVTEIDLSDAKYNYKAILQEYAQAHEMDLPDYKVVKEEGPPHNRTFEIEVFVNEESLGYGAGKSKKEAQQNAAKMGLISLGLYEETKKV